MLEILYRIYEVLPESEYNYDSYGFSLSSTMSQELLMDVYCCESRDDFKKYIKYTYGDDIKFAFSKKYSPGQLYCIIIGEHLFDDSVPKYFQRITFKCTHCNKEVTTFSKRINYIDDYTIRVKLGNDIKKYKDLPFCSSRCINSFVEKEHNEHFKDEFISDEFITPESYNYSNTAGYIYKISKKSTGEFYVGKTIYVPIFRWGQHLKSERFPISDIVDYKFEVLEIVPKDISLSEREDYYIHKCYNEYPDKSLNIANLQKDRRLAEQNKKYKINILKSNEVCENEDN